MTTRFTKMHGLGNDFVVIDATEQAIELNRQQLRAIADRRFGIGCDQILLIEPARGPDTLFHYRIFNADGSEYCRVDTTSFRQPIGLSERFAPAEADTELERVDPDPVLAPPAVAGFVRLDTYRWRESGAASFYSDGLFSFTLLSAPTTFSLSDSDATDVELDGGTYRRLFEPGRSTYVWESEMGGMSLVGDLPLDLQEAVLAELAPAERPGLLTRLWRRLFR